MFFSIVLILIFLLITLLLGYKKHITWVFFCYFFGVALLICASAIYTLKFSTYTTDQEIDRFLYYNIYPIFAKLKFGLSSASTTINIGLMLIFFGSAYQIKLIAPSGKLRFIVLCVVIVLFGILNFHEIRYYEFLTIQYSDKSLFSGLVTLLGKYTNTFSFVFFMFMLILPHFFILKTLIRSRVEHFRKNALSSFLCLIMIDIFVAYYFIFGMFSVFMPWNVDLLKFPLHAVRIRHQSFTNPILILIFIITLYIMIRYNPFKSLRFRTKKTILKEYTELNHSLRMIFHVNKNILQSVYLLSDQALSFFEKRPEITIKNLEDIKNTAADSQSTLIRMMNMLDDVSIKDLKTDITANIKEAVSKANLPESIKIIHEYDPDRQIIVKAESVHMVECFTNILKNAAEAIDTAKRENGIIKIFISTEQGYANIEITDNGCGIPRKKQSSIFNILTSSKKSAANWGIGLAYVKKVTDVYGGDVCVKSRVDKYTKFQIIFPLYKKDNKIPLLNNANIF